jgi:hypothetical protein
MGLANLTQLLQVPYRFSPVAAALNRDLPGSLFLGSGNPGLVVTEYSPTPILSPLITDGLDTSLFLQSQAGLSPFFWNPVQGLGTGFFSSTPNLFQLAQQGVPTTVTQNGLQQGNIQQSVGQFPPQNFSQGEGLPNAQNNFPTTAQGNSPMMASGMGGGMMPQPSLLGGMGGNMGLGANNFGGGFVSPLMGMGPMGMMG